MGYQKNDIKVQIFLGCPLATMATNKNAFRAKLEKMETYYEEANNDEGGADSWFLVALVDLGKVMLNNDCPRLHDAWGNSFACIADKGVNYGGEGGLESFGDRQKEVENVIQEAFDVWCDWAEMGW